jgi:hypothetical protein
VTSAKQPDAHASGGVPTVQLASVSTWWARREERAFAHPTFYIPLFPSCWNPSDVAGWAKQPDAHASGGVPTVSGPSAKKMVGTA